MINTVKSKKILVHKLVEEYSENIDGNEIISNKTLNYYGKICGFSTIYIVLSVIFFIISISINSVFSYLHWYLKKKIF